MASSTKQSSNHSGHATEAPSRSSWSRIRTCRRRNARGRGPLGNASMVSSAWSRPARTVRSSPQVSPSAGSRLMSPWSTRGPTHAPDSTASRASRSSPLSSSSVRPAGQPSEPTGHQYLRSAAGVLDGRPNEGGGRLMAALAGPPPAKRLVARCCLRVKAEALPDPRAQRSSAVSRGPRAPARRRVFGLISHGTAIELLVVRPRRALHQASIGPVAVGTGVAGAIGAFVFVNTRTRPWPDPG
jgi:hypothetical protein